MPCCSGFLNASSVPSGDRDGHSTSARITTAWRASIDPFTRKRSPWVFSVAKKWSPSPAKVTPQKLKSADVNRLPSFSTGNSSRSASCRPVAVSITIVLVENTASAYECPFSNTVRAARLPSGATLARIGGPVNAIV